MAARNYAALPATRLALIGLTLRCRQSSFDAFERGCRAQIAAMGTGLGLMLGLVVAGAKEMKNTSLKNLKDVRADTNLPVLSSIPLLENALSIRRKRRLLWLAWATAIMIGSFAMSAAAYCYYSGPKA